MPSYALCSIAAELRVTQTVNQHNGVHGMLRKEYLVRRGGDITSR